MTTTPTAIRTIGPASVERNGGPDGPITPSKNSPKAAKRPSAEAIERTPALRCPIGEIVSSKKADQAVPALTAGTYFFRCDVHTDMKGEIVAK